MRADYDYDAPKTFLFDGNKRKDVGDVIPRRTVSAKKGHFAVHDFCFEQVNLRLRLKQLTWANPVLRPL